MLMMEITTCVTALMSGGAMLIREIVRAKAVFHPRPEPAERLERLEKVRPSRADALLRRKTDA
jgi:hypothetical protein